MATLPFSYDEFEAWHRRHVSRLLGPALSAANTALDSYFDQSLPENQRVRVTVARGRVKSVARTWRKMHLPRYIDRIGDLDSIPIVLDDLIATRIICTNTSDLNRVWDLLCALEPWRDGLEPVLALESGSERDYCTVPKDTGYRARHLNVRTAVNDGLGRSLVTCEVQLRTLLQDSWGELTHEDTYKPGSAIPPLVTTLARRMADLLATLDEIAEDLRSELDAAADEVLEDVPPEGHLQQPEVDKAQPGSTEVAAKAYLHRRVSELTRPLDLATLAWELQREFGQDISQGWLGHDTFKGLLMAACPGVTISSTPPSFVVPAGYRFIEPPQRPLVSPDVGELPLIIEFLKSVDRDFPLRSAAAWRETFKYVGKASGAFREGTGFNPRLLNELTRIARDRAAGAGVHLPRAAFDYVARGLWYSNQLRARMSEDEVGELFVQTLLTRVGEVISVSEKAKRELRDWLGLSAGPSPGG